MKHGLSGFSEQEFSGCAAGYELSAVVVALEPNSPTEPGRVAPHVILLGVVRL